MKYVSKISRTIYENYKRLTYRKLSMAFSVKSHLTIIEQIMLYELSKNMPVIAEIGSYVGASACCFGAASKEIKEKQIICIDTWNNDAMPEGNRDTWLEFNRNISSFADFIIPVRGFSTDVVDEVRKISLNFNLLFIDGDHSYEAVKTDWESYKGFLRPGSVIVFHDYGWAEGVKRVVHDDVMPLAEIHDQLPNMWWCTLAKTP